MKKLILAAALFTNTSFAATYSQKTQDILFPSQFKLCVENVRKGNKASDLSKIENYCECGVKKVLAMKIEDQEDDEVIIETVEPCIPLLF